MKIFTKSKKFLLNAFAFTIIAIIAISNVQAQLPGDDYKPNFKDNPYCHPYDNSGMRWNGSENLRAYKNYGWGYWYECYQYYPYARIDRIEWYEKGSSTPIWYWELDNCCKWFPAYIYITGPADEGGWGGVPVTGNRYSTGTARVDPNNKDAGPGETWEPIQLKLGKTYTMKFWSNDYLRSTYYTHFYWDIDNDKEFDYRGNELIEKWTTPWNQLNYRNSPYENCFRGYYYGGSYSYNYTNRNYYWAEYSVDVEIPSDGLVLGEPNRMRLKRVYGNNSDDACQLYRVYGRAPNQYTYDYYGQMIDFDIVFKGIEIEPYPNEGTLTYANELYNDENRQPKIGGANIDFPKPEVTFVSPPSDGLEMEYTIIGPRPSQTEIYRATNANTGTRIKVGPSDLSTKGVQVPDPDNPGQTMTVQRYFWKAGFAGQYEASTNGVFVKNENNQLLQDGSFYTAQSGEYAVVINFFNPDGSPAEGGSDLFYNFTIKTGYDLTVQKILEPKPVSEPWFETHILNSQRQVKADIKNIGLNPINDFKVRYTIKGIDENTEGIEQSDMFIYDDIDYGTLDVDDIFTVNFSKLFEGRVVGDYSVIIEVYDADGEGVKDKEQSHFNDYYPRPYGGNQVDGWLVADSYVIRYVYQHDLAAMEVIVPAAEPESDVDRIYANRPFRPMVKFANHGQQDLAQEVYADLTIYRESDQEIVATVNDYSVEYVPAGLRFNTVDVQFPSVVIKNPGTYRIEAHIRSIFEDPAARLIGNNTVIDYFEVEDGMQGVFTVGMLNAGKEKNFNTIYDAMDALYTFGMNGNITFELTDAQYDLSGNPAWDFTSTIIGLGYVEEANETFTMTWKAASNRAMIKGGVQINMSSDKGYGVKFGQGLEYFSVVNAPVNQSEDPNYINSGGHITFDGGMLKSLKFVMTSGDIFSAPFYLGNGSQNIKLKNLIIENGNESLSGNSVRLPIIKGATTVGNEVIYQNNKVLGVQSYSAGIVNRGQLFNFTDPEVILPPKFDIEDIDTMSNKNNEFVGNEISGFGYGIVSIGMGGLYDIQEGSYVNYNGTNNKINNNVIYNVARAGIAIGNEENGEVKGNHIYDVNPNDISTDATTDMFDHAGIMVGGLIYETETINGKTTKLKGYPVKNILVDGNRINNVQSMVAATGIKIEQTPVFFDANSENASMLMPEMESNVRVINNIVKDIFGTDDNANRAGVHLFTQRQYGDNLLPGDDHPTFRTMNDKISNNTIILTSSPNADTEGLIAGIGIQQATGTDVSNNVIVLDDLSISPNSQVASAVFVQGQYANAGGPNLDFNVYSVNPNSNAQTVRFIEMNPTNNQPKYSTWMLYKDEFTNLEQWRIESGSDKHSIEYDAMQDLEIDGRDVKIKMTNGQYPIGSALNNRGKKINWYNYDINGNERGLTGQRYDVGALEFKGRQYTSDLELVRISAPAAYRSTVVDPLSGADFTDAEYIMTEGAIPVVAEVRNDGSLQQSDVELTLTIFRRATSTYSMVDTLLEVVSVKKLATIPSSNETLVDFGMADGIGEDFKPQTYGFFNNDKNKDGSLNTSNDYVVDSRFVGMEANVTPIYVIRVEAESDENNGNNISEKEVRFYLRKSERYLVLSVTDNQGSFQSVDANVVAGSMNTQILKTALLSFNWAANPVTGQYDYDVFDRNGWEKRSVNYDMYQTLIWSDGYTGQDGGNRFSTTDVRNFLASGLDINKKNLIIASQDMVKEVDADFRREVLRTEYEGVAWSGTYTALNVLGKEIAKGTSFTVSDYTEQYLGADDVMYHPTANALKPINEGGNGTSYVGFSYEQPSIDDEFKTNAMGIATVSVTNNTVYLGLDWRHFGNLTTLFAGVLDFIEANDAPIVPVELSDFNAAQQGTKVSIDWMTSSEVNSSRFEVERRTENTEIYNTIETVEAQGTSTTEQSYGPYFDYGVRYGNSYVYRLKMIDKDGSSEYSQEKVVTMKGGSGNIEVISVGPNPLQTKSELRLNLSETMNVTIELYDVVGNQVSTIVNGTLRGGTNTIEINGTNLSNGMYNIVIRSGDLQIIEPITVVK